MGKFIDITGKTFGRWSVIKREGVDSAGHILWHCKCICGKENLVSGSDLHSGRSKSCGCLNLELKAKRAYKHGLRHHPYYDTYRSMIRRCCYPSNSNYARYGGRGITVCQRWKDSIEAFLEDIKKLPYYGVNGYTLDRIDNDGPYSPENVRFSSNWVQNRNKHNNVWVNINGANMILSDAARLLHVAPQVLGLWIRKHGMNIAIKKAQKNV